MTLRAGSYDENWRPPKLHGCIRNDGTGWFACEHVHPSSASARACAQAALPEIRKATDITGAKVTDKLPDGWHVI